MLNICIYIYNLLTATSFFVQCQKRYDFKKLYTPKRANWFLCTKCCTHTVFDFYATCT